MGWQITFGGTRRTLTADDLKDPYCSKWEGGKVVNLDTLTPDTYDAIAREDTEATWWGVYKFPTSGGERMYRVAGAAAKLAEVDAPIAAGMKEAAEVMSWFEQTRDIEDQPVVEGFPQTPGGQESGSSSGLSESSDGSLQPQEENQ